MYCSVYSKKCATNECFNWNQTLIKNNNAKQTERLSALYSSTVSKNHLVQLNIVLCFAKAFPDVSNNNCRLNDSLSQSNDFNGNSKRNISKYQFSK